MCSSISNSNSNSMSQQCSLFQRRNSLFHFLVKPLPKAYIWLSSKTCPCIPLPANNRAPLTLVSRSHPLPLLIGYPHLPSIHYSRCNSSGKLRQIHLHHTSRSSNSFHHLSNNSRSQTPHNNQQQC